MVMTICESTLNAGNLTPWRCGLRRPINSAVQDMENPFYDRPILNSPYEYPYRHWELDETGQPTQQVIDSRRGAEFITPFPSRGRGEGRAVDAKSSWSLTKDRVFPRQSSSMMLPPP